jgi:hypothetical protein
VQRGRPLIEHCSPAFGEDGERNDWGVLNNTLLWDEETGWCTSDTPTFR